MVHDFPAEATFLTPDDRARVLRRLRADKQASASHEEFQMKYFWEAITDWKTYCFMAIYQGCDGALYGMSPSLPVTTTDLRTNTNLNSLLPLPPNNHQKSGIHVHHS